MMDKKYELVCIIDPQVGDGGFDPIIEKYQGQLEGQGGQMVNLDKWGMRKLAFTSVSMKRRQQGFYVCYQFTAPPGDFEAVQHELKLDEDILRYLLIAVPGEFIRVPVLAPDTVYVREREERFSRGRGGPGARRPDRPDRPPRPPDGEAAAGEGTAAPAEAATPEAATPEAATPAAGDVEEADSAAEAPTAEATEAVENKATEEEES
jgi:small subunit ribosomal protein S6